MRLNFVIAIIGVIIVNLKDDSRTASHDNNRPVNAFLGTHSIIRPITNPTYFDTTTIIVGDGLTVNGCSNLMEGRNVYGDMWATTIMNTSDNVITNNSQMCQRQTYNGLLTLILTSVTDTEDLVFSISVISTTPIDRTTIIYIYYAPIGGYGVNITYS